MTLKEIKAMFKVGQVWRGTRTPGFDGAPQRVTDRHIEKVQGNGFKARVDGKAYWTYFPKAVDVKEARAGYLRFTLPDLEAEVELVLI
jgi:hypothetical protein